MKRYISFLAALLFTAPFMNALSATPGEITVAVESLGDHLDPHRPFGNAADVLMAVFDSLTKVDADGEVIPSLLSSWEAIDDTTWVLDLEEGVKFHTGEEFNADVLMANIDRLNDPAEQRSTVGFEGWESWRKTGDYQIEVTTVAPNPLFPASLTRFLVAPPDMLDNPKSDEFNRHPIGTGPYKFVEWVADDRITLVANEDYYLGAPEIQKITFRAVPEAASRVSELISGGVDVITDILPEYIDLIDSNPGTRIATTVSPVNNAIILRTDVESPLQDVRVRQALNYAVDFDTIIETILSGYAHRYATVVHPFVLGFNADVEPYPYDPEKARELLAEAGYADGFDIDMDITPSVGGTNNIEVAEAILNYLRQVGINVNMNIREYGTMRTLVYGDRTAAPIIRWQWKTWYNDPDGVFDGMFHSHGLGTFNFDPEIDAMVEAARYNLDQEDRERIYRELQEYVKEEATHIFMYYLDTIYGVADRLVWEPRVDERFYFYDAHLAD